MIFSVDRDAIPQIIYATLKIIHKNGMIHHPLRSTFNPHASKAKAFKVRMVNAKIRHIRNDEPVILIHIIRVTHANERQARYLRHAISICSTA